MPTGLTPSGKVTVVVRPEHADLAKAGKSQRLSGMLENIVYFGTDTHYHVQLADGRRVHRPAAEQPHWRREPLRWATRSASPSKRDAAQVLRD